MSKIAHPLTTEQIEQLRADARGLAADLGCDVGAAYDGMAIPDYVWRAASAAADAAGPAAPRTELFPDLLAADTGPRERAHRETLDAIRAAVVAA